MAAAQAAIAAGNFPAAGAALAPLASAGDAQAQFQWASLALDGRSVGLAPERAISLLVQAAAQGNAHAQARLGMAYAHGDHVAPNNLAAYNWLSRAGAAADLSDEERTRISALRQELLEEIAPTKKYEPGAAPTATGAVRASDPAIPPAERATAAPVKSVSSVPLFSDPPLPTAADDDATAAGADTDGATTGSATAGSAASKPAGGTAPNDAAGKQSSTEKKQPAAGGKAYFLQLASLPTSAAAAAEATRLAKKYAGILQNVPVNVRAADLGAKGVRQRVVAGPFDDPGSARDRCAQLTAHQQACRVISAGR